MRGFWSKGPWFCVSVLCATACSFSVSTGMDVPIDAIDAPDAPPLPVLYWMTVAQSDGAAAKVTVIPIKDGEFESACAEQPAPGNLPFRDVLPHPSLPYVYAIEAGFHGASVACGALTWSSVSNATSPRPVQRIAYDAGRGVGFFTGDGPSAVGVYRFTTAANGTPTLNGTADATSESGPLTLDAAKGELFVTGPMIASAYALVGTNLDLPATRTNQSTCNVPVDVLVSGDTLLGFCNDSPDIRRFSRNPFMAPTTAGTMGATDRVIPLPGDRAFAARSTPDLVVIKLGAGTPTWTVGPSVASRITALAASTDGKLVATARLVNGTTSEISTWQVNGDAITLLDSSTVPGVVTALALAPRPI